MKMYSTNLYQIECCISSVHEKENKKEVNNGFVFF